MNSIRKSYLLEYDYEKKARGVSELTKKTKEAILKRVKESAKETVSK